jgi:hypothetical protein
LTDTIVAYLQNVFWRFCNDIFDGGDGKPQRSFQMKKNKISVFGMLAMVLALGLVFAGCDTGNDGGGQQIDAADLYGNWEATDTRAYDCYVIIAANGLTLSMNNGFSDYGTYTIAGSTVFN